MHMKENHYRHLGMMAALSFLAMYILMYAMVDSFDHVYMNINQFYMAGLMAAPMVLIELVVMRGMYHDKRLNAVLAAASALVGVLMFVFIRQQTAVSDGQFLRSMIPHHSGAILMCQKAPLQDAEIRKLCEAIVSGQQQEIDQMTAKLRQLQ
jgi:peptidoglycan/LPS O-acetylase OafA/YrhL